MEHHDSIILVAVTVSDSNDCRNRKRGASIAGICAAAANLGVSRQHLWAVLRGHRQSAPLLARYKANQALAGKQIDKSKEKK